MLTEKAISQAKPKEKTYRLYDAHGLYLEIAPAGGKWWRLKYRLDGRESRVSLGTYPLISLKEARDRAWDTRKGLEQGIDPVKKKRCAQEEQTEKFEAVAVEWWEKFMKPNGGRYPDDVMRMLKREVFPYIGGMSIKNVDAPAVLSILRRIESRGTIETAHKIKSYISQTLRYGIAMGLITYNPARDLAGAIAPKRKKPMAAIIDPKGVGGLMRSIEGYEGSGVVRCALKVGALTFVRPGELRTAEWKDVDIDAAEWRIPAGKMKMKRAHIVPLSTQAVAVLLDLRTISGEGRYLFPSIRTSSKPMSDMTVNAALRAMGYSQDRMTGHGFRAMASSLLAEQGWGIDAIERQLAHIEKNAVRAAYHRSEHLAERRRMMQAWADYLDELRASV